MLMCTLGPLQVQTPSMVMHLDEIQRFGIPISPGSDIRPLCYTVNHTGDLRGL